VEPDAVEIRVLGCLIEKQRTTPDAYPLSLNALRVACNQATNRDPVVDYDEATVREATQRLAPRRWARQVSLGRTPKYRHLLNEALNLAPDEISVLCVLMLRGPQTPGELKQRTGRLFDFADLADLQATLDRLVLRELAEELPRRPGQKEARFVQLIGGDEVERAPADGAPAPHHRDDDEAPAAAYVAAPDAPPPATASPSAEELDELRGTVTALRSEVAELRAALDRLRSDLGA
jgi:uncharacterized protein YceH (UPF0502 family)